MCALCRPVLSYYLHLWKKFSGDSLKSVVYFRHVRDVEFVVAHDRVAGRS